MEATLMYIGVTTPEGKNFTYAGIIWIPGINKGSLHIRF